MLLIAASEHSRFSLEICGAAKAEPLGDTPRWLAARVQWSNGGLQHDVVSECLTEAEARELAAWISALETARGDQVLSFTEPSLSFVYLQAPDVVLVSLWQELAHKGNQAALEVLAFSRADMRLSRV